MKEEISSVEIKCAEWKKSSEEENSAKPKVSVQENWTKENSSSEENGEDENSSSEENSEDEDSLSEEHRTEENNSSSEENQEKMNDDFPPMKVNREKEFSSDSSEEENSPMEDDYEKLMEDLIEDHGLVFEMATVGKKVCVVDSSDSSEEENSSMEDDYEKLMEDLIEDHGLVFEKATVVKKVCAVEIVVVGSVKCDKTKLIQSVFADHPSFEVKNYDECDKYQIYFKENLMCFHIWIYDIKDAEYASRKKLRKKNVAFFCYDSNDLESLVCLEEIWFPTKCHEGVPCFLIGIEHDAEAKPTETGTDQKEKKMAIEKKAKDLCVKVGRMRQIFCSIAEKDSMLKVFQSAIEAVYPMNYLCQKHLHYLLS